MMMRNDITKSYDINNDFFPSKKEKSRRRI